MRRRRRRQRWSRGTSWRRWSPASPPTNVRGASSPPSSCSCCCGRRTSCSRWTRRSGGRPRRSWSTPRWRTCSSRATPAARRRSTTWTASSVWSGTYSPRKSTGKPGSRPQPLQSPRSRGGGGGGGQLARARVMVGACWRCGVPAWRGGGAGGSPVI
ncbi:hypothetical protein DAI22_12g134600 [Oryza sativa Japonica Group]|nr:hypothetical protein DAI22_12g134600 [Oryza sativa Japonica Group]